MSSRAVMQVPWRHAGFRTYVATTHTEKRIRCEYQAARFPIPSRIYTVCVSGNPRTSALRNIHMKLC